VKPARFHPEAEVELTAEAKYYEECSPGLGERFLAELQAAEASLRLPQIGAPYRYGTRRVFPKNFPFSIVYRDLAAEILILTIAPFPRKPAYWQSRQSGA
jgi:hypothetical protein